MGDDPTKRGAYSHPEHWFKQEPILYHVVEFERQTFERLWAESGGNSEEARHLMRTPERQYYEDDITGKTELDHMPNVIYTFIVLCGLDLLIQSN